MLLQRIKNIICISLAYISIVIKFFIFDKNFKVLRWCFICSQIYNSFSKALLFMSNELTFTKALIFLFYNSLIFTLLYCGISIIYIYYIINLKSKHKEKYISNERFLDECHLAKIQGDITGIEKISKIIVLTDIYGNKNKYFFIPYEKIRMILKK